MFGIQLPAWCDWWPKHCPPIAGTLLSVLYGAEMRRGERAMLNIKPDYAFLHKDSGLPLPQGLRREAPVVADVTVSVGCWQVAGTDFFILFFCRVCMRCMLKCQRWHCCWVCCSPHRICLVPRAAHQLVPGQQRQVRGPCQRCLPAHAAARARLGVTPPALRCLAAHQRTHRLHHRAAG